MVTVNVTGYTYLLSPALWDCASRAILDSSQPQAEARAHPWQYLTYFSGNSHTLGIAGLALLICLSSQFLQLNIIYGTDKSVSSCLVTLHVPLACVVLLGGQVYGLLVCIQHRVWPNCFYLAHTTPSVQLTVALGGVKNSIYLMGHCSTHPSTSL